MSKIDQVISDIEAYLDNCKGNIFSPGKIVVEKQVLLDLLSDLRSSTPDEIRKYQKIINNRESILSDAQERANSILNESKEKADSILTEAQMQTEELINEHEIMQRAYAQANQLIEQATSQAQNILDSATEDSNNIRIGAVEYTDDMLGRLQYIIEHSIKDNKEKYNSLLSDLENVLSIVQNNRKELKVTEEVSESDENTDKSQEKDVVTQDTILDIPSSVDNNSIEEKNSEKE